MPLANLIDTKISRLGVVTNDVALTDKIRSFVTCVRYGLGISIVPHVALEEPESSELTRLTFGNPRVTRQIGILERTRSPRRKTDATAGFG